jgi:hypothetical protein
MPATPPGLSRVKDQVKITSIGLVSKSNAKNPDEILFSGITRLATPVRTIKRWIRRAT